MSYRLRTERRATHLDSTVWILEGPAERAEIWPALGFNCYRWHVCRGGTEYELLYAAPTLFEEAAPTRSGFPILFPFPNRIRGGRYFWDGRAYQLPLNDNVQQNAIHGFACRRPWRIVDHGADAEAAWLTGEFHGSRDAAECAALWPADYRIRVTYRLTGQGLAVQAVVDNTDRKSLPFGLGYHPYFRVPFATAGAEAWVDAPAAAYWELNECLPSGKRFPVEGLRDLRRPRPLEGLQLDDVLTDLAAGPSGADGLLDRGGVRQGGLAVRLRCSPDFSELVAFTPPHRQAVCLEPYTCVTDAVNLAQRGLETGWRTLPPGGQWRGEVECVVSTTQ